MGKLITVASCSLNQWALDFDGNTERILESIRQAKAAGAKLRVGPELEVCGYGCADHYLEGDLFLHCWESLATIISNPDVNDCILDIGMPVRHNNVRYNCRVIVLNRKILLIRPKMALCEEGNYFESRWFTPWTRQRQIEDYPLEDAIRSITGQRTVPFGDAVLTTIDTSVACETCEELFTPAAPHVPMGLNGVEIFTNSSGSHYELRKLQTRVSLIREATRQNGGIYVYSNQRGCSGDRLYYDGCAMIIVNGRLLAQGSQFSLNDVETITANVDIEDVRSFRVSHSRNLQAAQAEPYPRIHAEIRLSHPPLEETGTIIPPSPDIPIHYHSAAEEIQYAPALWMWDYLRRSRTAGYFLALSGGVDSCSTAVLVWSMCRLVYDAITSPKTLPHTRELVLSDCRRVCAQEDDWTPSSPQEICSFIFHTTYMGSKNSSRETRTRAADLARAIGAYHLDLSIDTVVSALTTLFTTVTGFAPSFTSSNAAEGLALQNIQARIRMVIAYFFAQLLPSVRKRKGNGGLLVLGSANVDEQLRGYLTKYDCSSADINPIGGISKVDLRMFLAHARDELELPLLQSFLDATPTAELIPTTNADSHTQSDEVEMGMTYAELSVMGRLRKIHRLGPWGVFEKLLPLWTAPPPDPETIATEDHGAHSDPQYVHSVAHGESMTPRSVYEKVRRFFYYYAINRHKQTTLTPGLHMEQYSPDDHRYDMRPFLYPSFTAQYRKMEGAVKALEEREEKNQEAKAGVNGA
ncbi:NAD+ synthetase [Exophiala oligosperma]|uniref:Glutamine-dependent NAD(+) synthetase n=2 Tax=Chaetothyriales TaxID=34395 RepID=A0A0D2EDE0_9EURO|nr:NAD+ synthetase [Exophiala oligosperma]KAJ9618044.1 glutamine-dependent NAD(+) synthetase [Knufia peltigerae]KIW45944.1 NAD+ synthetase [Exophiala oligosperma]